MTRYPHRITLQSATVQSFKGGCSTVTWNTVTSYWANISETGREEYTNVKGQQKSMLKIIMRDFLTLDKATDRFAYNGQNIHIESFNDKTNRGREMIIIGRVENDA